MADEACEGAREACRHVLEAERLIKDMDDRLSKVERGVDKVEGKLDRLAGELNGQMTTLLHMTEEGTRAREALAATVERFIGTVDQSLRAGEARMGQLEQQNKVLQEKAQAMAPVAEVASKVRGFFVMGLAVGLAALTIGGLVGTVLGAQYLLSHAQTINKGVNEP